ncbi:MAG: hypothetical protein KAH32_01015 [Chlamydiia bacterium]|nr:hypothetical protein [Chlamydiia bacterium]
MFGLVNINIGDKIPAPAAIKTLLQTFTVAKTGKLINDILSKPLRDIDGAS